MRTRADDAHVAEEDVPKLRDLVDAEFAKPFPEWINALVIVARLPRFLLMILAHRAKLVNFELSILQAGAGLHVKERAGRLQTLRHPDDEGEDRENEKHDGNGDGQIDGTFEKTIERILERLFAQTDKAKAVV